MMARLPPWRQQQADDDSPRTPTPHFMVKAGGRFFPRSATTCVTPGPFREPAAQELLQHHQGSAATRLAPCPELSHRPVVVPQPAWAPQPAAAAPPAMVPQPAPPTWAPQPAAAAPPAVVPQPAPPTWAPQPAAAAPPAVPPAAAAPPAASAASAQLQCLRRQAAPCLLQCPATCSVVHQRQCMHQSPRRRIMHPLNGHVRCRRRLRSCLRWASGGMKSPTACTFLWMARQHLMLGALELASLAHPLSEWRAMGWTGTTGAVEGRGLRSCRNCITIKTTRMQPLRPWLSWLASCQH